MEWKSIVLIVFLFLSQEGRSELESIVIGIIGSSLTLTCGDKLEVKWFRNGRLLTETSSPLLLSGLQSSDSGSYTCSSESNWEFIYRVLILPPTSLEHTRVSLVKKTSELHSTVDNGRLNSTVIHLSEDDQNVILVCSIIVPTLKSHMRNTYYWIPFNSSLGNPFISSQQTLQKLDSDSSVFLSVLKFNFINSSLDGNQFTCHHLTIVLDIDYSPTFTLTRIPRFGIPIFEGMTISLECEVDVQGSENSLKYWYRDNKLLSESFDGNLVIENVNISQHVGWYICLFFHKNRNYTSMGYLLKIREFDTLSPLSVNEGPPNDNMTKNCSRLWIRSLNSSESNNNVLTVRETSNVYLSMMICSGVSIKKIFWVSSSGIAIKEPPQVLNQPLSQRSHLTCVISTLWLSSVKKDKDEGEYILYAKNTHGIGDASITLFITHIPKPSNVTLTSKPFAAVAISSTICPHFRIILLICSFLFQSLH